MTWKGINALDTHITVAIDGPSGAGKSTIARAAARRFGLIYVDTGAIYRTVGLAGERAGVNCSDADAMQALLPTLRIELVYDAAGEQRMLLNGEDVSETIRLPEVSLLASRVSALPVVRAFLLDMQRSLARTHSVVMDGRDIGTVVLPDAGLKIFLSASAECRAQRRWRQLQEKGIRVYAAHLEGSVCYDEPDYTGGTAFLIGNEGNGLTAETAKLADTYIRIPMGGQLESLNAAMAAGILMYEASRQRRG